MTLSLRKANLSIYIEVIDSCLRRNDKGMRYSQLFGKTRKTAPSDADSANARLLEQGGFVDQLMAGVYTYMPLGLRVLKKIQNIIREEMNAIGGQEVLMPALTPAEPWKTTGRWEDPGPEVMFQFKGRGDRDMGLGWTHEEVITPLAKQYINSYRDLPLALYQIQDKFRNEPRAKSGLLRGREFSMKDLYSFHADEEDFNAFYEKAREAYHRIFERCGLNAIYTKASGGAFSKYSHEFQVLTPSGEDIIFQCEGCNESLNREIAEDMKDGDPCPGCKEPVKEGKAIEVGNIFPLKTRFTDAFGVKYNDADGKQKEVLMGCYGIGPSRVMGAVVEVHHDENGILWPAEVAPFDAHVVMLHAKDDAMQKRIDETVEALEKAVKEKGKELLIDDRNMQAGAKFADADLIGCPVRIVVSAKTLEQDGVGWKERSGDQEEIIKISDAHLRF